MIDNNQVAILLLAVCLIISHGVWMIYTNRLINKLMSRNYAEYLQSRKLVKKEKDLGPKEYGVETFNHPKERLDSLSQQLFS